MQTAGYNSSGSKAIKPKPFDEFAYKFSAMLFFGALVFQICIGWWTENTIFGMRLFWKSALAGVFIAFIVTMLIKWKRPSVYHESNRRISVHLGLFLGFALLMPALTSFINHVFADKAAYCTNYEIDHLSKGGKRNRTSYLFIVMEKQEERFQIKSATYDELQNSREVQLCIRKGKLGYEFVEEFKVPD